VAAQVAHHSHSAVVQHSLTLPMDTAGTRCLLCCRLLAVFFALYAVLMIVYSLTTFRALRAAPYHAFRTGELSFQCSLCGVTQNPCNVLTASPCDMHRQHDCADPGLLLPAPCMLDVLTASSTARRQLNSHMLLSCLQRQTRRLAVW
jgi:hypothetical protein